jgi:hypothetical protein
MEIREVAPAARDLDELTAEAGAEEKAPTTEFAGSESEMPADDSGSQRRDASATDRSACDDRQPDAALPPPEEFADVEARAVLREIADMGLLWAADLAEATSDIGAVEETDAVATRSLTDYSQRAVELARQNANMAFHFAADLVAAKTLAEVAALSTAHARRQFEAFSGQSMELAMLVRKAASKPITSATQRGVEKAAGTRSSAA